MNEPIYELIIDESSNKMVKKINPDGSVWWIPTDPANSDYQEYLKSLEA